ncbi:HNH endonuclease family protein [Gordonia malaquae]|uniref:HNH endonuclease family protein n=1 Tax=Gordonia malaquae TaxID=410332 RepID=UPI00301A208E
MTLANIATAAARLARRLPRRLPASRRGWIRLVLLIVPVIAVVAAMLASPKSHSDSSAAPPSTSQAPVGSRDALPPASDLPSVAPEATSAAPTAEAPPMAILESLPVRGKAPETGYDRRGSFGPPWTDDVTVQGGHNGCDTKSDIRRRDLVEVTIKPGTHGCKVTAGILHDKYTGTVVPFDKINIEHIVALKNAWITGAQNISAARRQDLANDPINLLAVDGKTNQSKGDKSADAWLPPNKAFRCEYITRQVLVKKRYDLWVTASEKSAMARVLAGC